MKRRVAGVVLALTVAVVVDLHVDWHRADNGVLLRVGEQDFDMRGAARQAWTRLTRRCGEVQDLLASEGAWDASLTAIRHYSPPDSLSTKLVRVSRQGQWLLAQAESDTLMPAVVTLRSHGGEIAVVPRGVWSGNTHPWIATPLIRDYLVRQVPGLPPALVDCLEIAPESPLQRPMPLRIPPPVKDTR